MRFAGLAGFAGDQKRVFWPCRWPLAGFSGACFWAAVATVLKLHGLQSAALTPLPPPLAMQPPTACNLVPLLVVYALGYWLPIAVSVALPMRGPMYDKVLQWGHSGRISRLMHPWWI